MKASKPVNTYQLYGNRQQWKEAPTDKWLINLFYSLESQDCWGWKWPREIMLFNSPALAGSAGAGSPGLCPVGFW